MVPVSRLAKRLSHAKRNHSHAKHPTKVSRWLG